jgi:low affinity Fe/Cu permease
MKLKMRNMFDRFAEAVSEWLGHPIAFTTALATVLVWAAFGPLAGFSQTWQLIINTGTTIATFLMVFLLQNTQNRDAQEHRDLIREMAKSQRSMLNMQRKISEKITAIEYQIDHADIDKPAKPV